MKLRTEIAIIVCLATLVVGLGAFLLMGTDEPRQAEEPAARYGSVQVFDKDGEKVAEFQYGAKGCRYVINKTEGTVIVTEAAEDCL